MFPQREVNILETGTLIKSIDNHYLSNKLLLKWSSIISAQSSGNPCLKAATVSLENPEISQLKKCTL